MTLLQVPAPSTRRPFAAHSLITAPASAASGALEAFAYRVAKYIGAYAAAMKGVDVIAFTAGAGENNAYVRGLIGEYIEFLGTNIDPEKNKVRGEEIILSDEGSKVVTMVVPTNEELAIARETVRLV